MNKIQIDFLQANEFRYVVKFVFNGSFFNVGPPEENTFLTNINGLYFRHQVEEVVKVDKI